MYLAGRYIVIAALLDIEEYHVASAEVGHFGSLEWGECEGEHIVAATIVGGEAL